VALERLAAIVRAPGLVASDTAGTLAPARCPFV
jgi:hypothetical protein